VARQGVAGEVWHGKVWLGLARYGWIGGAWLGVAGRGGPRCGWHGNNNERKGNDMSESSLTRQFTPNIGCILTFSLGRKYAGTCPRGHSVAYSLNGQEVK